jgi:hypothetical protein
MPMLRDARLVTLPAQRVQVLSMSIRRKLFQEMRFDLPVPFNQGDSGPCGGIQVWALQCLCFLDAEHPERLCVRVFVCVCVCLCAC